MKRFSDYSKLELVELNEDRIQELIDLEVAFAGIKPVIVPKQQTLEDIGIKADIVAYSVAGLLFAEESDAIAVSKMKILSEEYEYSCGYEYKWCDKEKDKIIQKKFYYKQEDVRRLQKALSNNKRKKEIYDKEDGDYRKYLDSISKIADDVWQAVSEANDLKREVEHAKEIYNKYLKLADNDLDMAKKFFTDAYKDSSEILRIILGISIDKDKDE